MSQTPLVWYCHTGIDAANEAAQNNLLDTLAKSGLGPPSFDLEYLRVDCSPIAHPCFIASFLSTIFPNLAYIKYSNHQLRIYCERWHTVRRVLIPMMRIEKGWGIENQGLRSRETGHLARAADKELLSRWYQGHCSGGVLDESWTEGESSEDESDRWQ